MLDLPIDFLNEIHTYLSDEDFRLFCSSYSEKAEKGIRVNTLKCGPEKLNDLLGLNLKPSPFSKKSLYVDESFKVGTNPLHSAGAFYSQEPSASSAVTILNPKPGDIVLDMCAAPGGKSTQIAAELCGEGLLISNEVSRSRANILLSNIERMGIRNAVVTNSYPEKFANSLPEYFDKILVDAPCSGEGMFRKDPDAIKEWSREHVNTCAVRQLAILNDAAKCLKPGGYLVYSTCTFSYEEDEGTVLNFLKENKDFELVPIQVSFGRKGLNDLPVLRIFPMDGGEGHFVAKLHKKGECLNSFKFETNSTDKRLAAVLTDLRSISSEEWNNITIKNDKIYFIPDNMPSLSGINVIRAGVLYGEFVKNRIEPHHQFFMASNPDKLVNTLDFDYRDEILIKFYHGEEITCNRKGFTGVCVNGITTGFGKASGDVLKNRYPKGLRYK